MKWKIVEKLQKSKTQKFQTEEVISTLLKNRGIKTKRQKEGFFEPTPPFTIEPNDVGLSKIQINKAIRRIKKAKAAGEQVIVYGDYDADGVCATAIVWEALNVLGIDAMPYIPDRFSEGYGLNSKGIENVKLQMPNVKLIITVDNGIVAHKAVKEANKLGIDVIITDHHKEEKKLPNAHSIIHTTKLGGAGVAWIFARELAKKIQKSKNPKIQYDQIELVAIGTVADQIPLLGANRSFVKYGLRGLKKTKRLGLLELYREARINKEDIDTYHINFVIAPRINAMGRLQHAIDSLRLICTLNKKRAKELALSLGSTNRKRQKIVEEVVLHAERKASKTKWEGAIMLAHESYHEGVIGLAAAKLVERFYRPAIVISKGKKFSKASARSISGFNIIDAIRQLDDFLHAGGGHPMAAGFTLKTERLKEFTDRFGQLTYTLLTSEILTRTLKIDLEIDFKIISWKLISYLKKFEPTGIGNFKPLFVTKDIKIFALRTVGMEAKHLKLKAEKEGKVFDAIGFGMGDKYIKLMKADSADIVYSIEENIWHGKRSIQLKLKDIKTS